MLSDMTKGPWAVYAHPINGKADAILELIEQVQATEPMADHIYLINADGKCPAITGCGPTSRANAQAIAALPDLIEALQGLSRYEGHHVHCGHAPDYIKPCVCGFNEAQAKAFAALTKAGGPQ